MQYICIKVLKTLGLLAVLAGALPLPAQVVPASDELTPELDEIVMEVVVPVDSMALVGGPWGVLRGAELERKTEASLGETLAWEPGVTSSFYGPVASRPIIRGLDGYRAGVFLNGLGTGDLSSASPDHAVAIEPMFIREIEIIRGPAGLLYGGSAIGGAVNVITTTIPRESPGGDGVAGALEGRYSSVDRGRTGIVTATVGDDRLVFQVNGLWRKTDSYKIPGHARTADYDINNRVRLPPNVPGPGPNPEGTVPNTQSETQTGSLGASYLFDHGWVGAAFTAYNSDYGVPSDGHTHGNPFGPPGFGPGPNDNVTIEMQQRRWEGAAGFWPAATWLEQLDVALSWSTLKQDEYEGIYLGNAFDGKTFDSRIEAQLPVLGAWDTRVGLQFTAFELFNENINYQAGRVDRDTLSTRSFNGALFGLTRWEEGPWEARLGGRAELQSAERTDRSNTSRNFSAFSVSTGAAYRVHEDGRAGLTLSFTERPPTADELYVEAPHGAIGIFQIPNPDLNNERSLGLDFSLEKDRGDWTFAFTGFYRHFPSFIYLENQGFEVDGLTAYRYVQRSANFVGAEFESTRPLYRSEESGLDVSALWDVVYGTDTTIHQPLPRIPPMRVGGRLDGWLGRWDAGVGLRYAFAQTRVPQAVFGTLEYQAPTASYLMLDANLGYTLKRGRWITRAYIQGTNLLNQEARNAASFLQEVAPLPGRNVTVGLSISY